MNFVSEQTATRSYRMRKRLEDVEETRRRIIDAAVDLHGSVGPAKTTFSAVADRAGVQRSTVYRHFADEEALFGACTSHWLADHPWPTPTDWMVEAAADKRLELGLRELYRYYAANEAMIANSFRDIDVMPEFVGEMMLAQLNRMHDVLVDAWPAGSRGRDLSAAVRHALEFRTWDSLTRNGLSPDEAARLMTAMITRGVNP